MCQHYESVFQSLGPKLKRQTPSAAYNTESPMHAARPSLTVRGKLLALTTLLHY
jgi:hypothetical protein